MDKLERQIVWKNKPNSLTCVYFKQKTCSTLAYLLCNIESKKIHLTIYLYTKKRKLFNLPFFSFQSISSQYLTPTHLTDWDKFLMVHLSSHLFHYYF